MCVPFGNAKSRARALLLAVVVVAVKISPFPLNRSCDHTRDLLTIQGSGWVENLSASRAKLSLNTAWNQAADTWGEFAADGVMHVKTGVADGKGLS
jgi:hypothetical protein